MRILGACIESIASCAFLDRLRFNDFQQRQSLVEAHEHLQEMDRLKSKLPQNGYKAGIDNLTESIINKVVRQHVKSLKKVVHDPELYKQQVDMILSIYELDKDN